MAERKTIPSEVLDFPCPRCGEGEDFWTQYHPGRGWYVMCDTCDWRGPEKSDEIEAIEAAKQEGSEK